MTSLIIASEHLPNILSELDRLTSCEAIPPHFWEDIKLQEITGDIRERAYRQAPKVEVIRRVWEQHATRTNPFYWEFAIDESHNLPVIVQSHLLGPRRAAPAEFEKLTGAVLCEGSEVVNVGSKRSKRIFIVGLDGFSSADFDLMEKINQQYPGCLLIVSEQAFSRTKMIDGVPLIGFKHYSNYW